MPPRARRNFTRGFKDDAVSLVMDNGYSCAGGARRLAENDNVIDRGPEGSGYAMKLNPQMTSPVNR